VYTSIDLGSHSVKIVVSERINDKMFVLASTKVRSLGIKKGVIKDKELVLESLKEAISNINKDLGYEIHEVILSFPLFCVNTSVEHADISIDSVVDGKSIQQVMNKVVLNNVSKDEEVLYLEPIVFELDHELQVVDPKGLSANSLSVRAVISTIDKNILYDYLEVFSLAGLEVVDITYGVVGDYYEAFNSDINKKLGVLVNVGYGKTEIAIFNKGILLKGSILPVGSKKIDKDISFIYKVDKNTAINLKENFAVCSSKYADKNDIIELTNINEEKISINQYEISQIIEARLLEIIKSVKNEINNLTNREISYIIITGGITNLVSFPYLIDEEFTCDKLVVNIPTLGVRDNSFSTSLGLTKYFDYKMKFRNIDYSMFNDCDKLELASKKRKGNGKNLMDKFSDYLKSN